MQKKCCRKGLCGHNGSGFRSLLLVSPSCLLFRLDKPSSSKQETKKAQKRSLSLRIFWIVLVEPPPPLFFCLRPFGGAAETEGLEKHSGQTSFPRTSEGTKKGSSDHHFFSATFFGLFAAAHGVHAHCPRYNIASTSHRCTLVLWDSRFPPAKVPDNFLYGLSVAFFGEPPP